MQHSPDKATIYKPYLNTNKWKEMSHTIDNLWVSHADDYEWSITFALLGRLEMDIRTFLTAFVFVN